MKKDSEDLNLLFCFCCFLMSVRCSSWHVAPAPLITTYEQPSLHLIRNIPRSLSRLLSMSRARGMPGQWRLWRVVTSNWKYLLWYDLLVSEWALTVPEDVDCGGETKHFSSTNVANITSQHVLTLRTRFKGGSLPPPPPPIFCPRSSCLFCNCPDDFIFYLEYTFCKEGHRFCSAIAQMILYFLLRIHVLSKKFIAFGTRRRRFSFKMPKWFVLSI